MNVLESTETDVAYYVLTKKGETMYYKDLVLDVIEKKAKPVQSLSQTISEVYTLINMDSRFQYTGKGMWGLTEWNPPEVKHSHSISSSEPSTSASTAKANRRLESMFESIQQD